jgi:hypothetical protein
LRGRALPFLVALTACAGDDFTAYPHLETCAPNWQVVTEPAASFTFPAAAVLGGGVLYYTFESPAARTEEIPLDPGGVGSSPSVFSSSGGDGLWIEGDRLLLIDPLRLRSIPLDGGQPTTLLDFSATATSSSFYLPRATVLDESDVYLVRENDFSSFGVERISRATGLATVLTPEPLVLQLDGQAILTRAGPGGLILSAAHADAWYVPTSGEPPRRIAAAAGRRVLADDDGVIWMVSETSADGIAASSSLYRNPVDGSARRPFWPTKSPRVAASNGWPDGAGGWVIEAQEPFADGQLHLSLWAVDPSEHGRRLACAPLVGASEVTAIAIAPDATYAAVGSFGFPLPDSIPSWTIVRSAR